jgi:hypothetical protein
LPSEILVCDPSTKTIQAITQAGVVHVSVYTADPFFRWPKAGENWIIKQENGNWYLDTILQNTEDDLLLKQLKPGDALLNTPGRIMTSNKTKIVQKFTEILGHENWNNEKEYVVKETVQHEGKAYVAISGSKNVNPTSVKKEGGEIIKTHIEGPEGEEEIEIEVEKKAEYWEEIPNGNKIFIINHNLNDFGVYVSAIELHVPHHEVKIAKRESSEENTVIVEFESNLEPYSVEIIVIG